MKRADMRIPDELYRRILEESARLEIGVSEFVRRLAYKYFEEKDAKK